MRGAVVRDVEVGDGYIIDGGDDFGAPLISAHFVEVLARGEYREAFYVLATLP